MVSSSIVLVVIQPEERNMYDQYWLSTVLKEIYPFAYDLTFSFCFHSPLFHQENFSKVRN